MTQEHYTIDIIDAIHTDCLWRDIPYSPSHAGCGRAAPPRSRSRYGDAMLSGTCICLGPRSCDDARIGRDSVSEGDGGWDRLCVLCWAVGPMYIASEETGDDKCCCACSVLCSIFQFLISIRQRNQNRSQTKENK